VYVLSEVINANTALLYALLILNTEPNTVSEQSLDVREEAGSSLNANPSKTDDKEMVFTPAADNTVCVGGGFPTEAADSTFEVKL
jgi:hypothetical protein